MNPTPHHERHAADTARGALRNPDDYTGQPEQGGDCTPPNPGHANPLNDHAMHAELQPPREPAPPAR